MASGAGTVSSEGPKKSWRQNVWRASRRNCSFTYSPTHTLELKHNAGSPQASLQLCLYLSVCVSVGLGYSSGSWETPGEGAKRRPRLKAHTGEYGLGVITGCLLYKFCLLLEAPAGSFQPLEIYSSLDALAPDLASLQCYFTTFGTLVSFSHGKEGRTQRTLTETFFFF